LAGQQAYRQFRELYRANCPMMSRAKHLKPCMSPFLRPPAKELCRSDSSP
jgi:hypothetical protein